MREILDAKAEWSLGVFLKYMAMSMIAGILIGYLIWD